MKKIYQRYALICSKLTGFILLNPLISLFFPLVLFLYFSIYLHLINGIWIGDFYHHSAAVNEFSYSLLYPKHPQYGIDGCSPYLTPYHFIVAVFSLLSGLSSIESLSYFSFINLSLLLISLYLFHRINSNDNLSFVLVIFIILFFWGFNPWLFSGALNIHILKYVLPYHSTFSISMALISLYLFFLYFKGRFKYHIIGILIISAMNSIAMLSQPITTFLIVSVYMAILFFDKTYLYSDYKRYLPFILVGMGTLLLLYLWPFYSYYKLIFVSSNIIKMRKELFTMFNFEHIAVMCFPLLIFIILFIVIYHKTLLRSIFVKISLILFLFYVIGLITGRESFGRTLLLIILIISFYLSDEMILFFKNKENKFIKKIIAYIFIFVICANILIFSRNLDINKREDIVKEKYDFLDKNVNHYDVIMTDLKTGYPVPSFSGKIVAHHFYEPFINDEHNERLIDLKLFYTSDNIKRKEILNKYSVKYLLINKNIDDYIIERDTVINLPQKLIDDLLLLGNITYENKYFYLLKIK